MDQLRDPLGSCHAARKTFARKILCAASAVRAYLDRLEKAWSGRVPDFDSVEIEHATHLLLFEMGPPWMLLYERWLVVG